MTSSYLAALLQTAPAPGGGSSGMTILLLQVAAIAVVFYLLIIRPQSTARKKHQQLLTQLKRGDEVMTAGGIIGKVKDIKDIETGGVKESRVTVESGNAVFVVERSRIVRIGATTAPGSS